jgi:thymidylate synthase ThyX
MTKISATIVADSKNQFGNRLTTFVLTFPRYILAELNTHRMLSKNSASSRAIPYKKMLESVKNNPFIPIRWMKDHSGMQGNEYWDNPDDIQNRIGAWLTARDNAMTHSEILNGSLNVTKQLTNRILEPFMWHTVILSGTEFENFFSLRCSEFADIHIQKLAYEMLEAYNASTPNYLKEGQWHIPFGDNIDESKLVQLSPYWSPNDGGIVSSEIEDNERWIKEAKIKVGTARCARISYTVVGEEGKPDNYENDIKLHDRLVSMGHMSPAEHVGRAMTDYEFAFDSSFNADDGEEGTWGWSGNFRGFVQYRKTLANENRKDARVVQK